MSSKRRAFLALGWTPALIAGAFANAAGWILVGRLSRLPRLRVAYSAALRTEGLAFFAPGSPTCGRCGTDWRSNNDFITIKRGKLVALGPEANCRTSSYLNRYDLVGIWAAVVNPHRYPQSSSMLLWILRFHVHKLQCSKTLG